jgi:acyl carrier protein
MKSLEEFVALFAEQFDETETSEITSDKHFRDLDEWSSLIGLSVIAMVDEEFDVILRGEDMRKANTPAELYEIIKTKM